MGLAAQALLAIVLAVLLVRVLLVGAFVAKILGRNDYLDGWKGAVSRQTTTIAGIVSDNYSRNSNAGFPVVIVHGVNTTGKDNLDIVRVAQSFAQVGFQVIVPDLTRMKEQAVSRQDAEDVLKVLESVGGNVGIVCISYGCGPALIAAADADVRYRVQFVVTFAGFFDMVSQLRFLVTAPENPLGYDKWF